jgi:orotidine-5'-phosphate decarboxylase
MLGFYFCCWLWPKTQNNMSLQLPGNPPHKLIENIYQKKSLLCVGLDTDPNLIPPHLMDYSDPVFEFNRQIIDATLPYTVAYKPNLAFYEALGLNGWESLYKTMEYLGGRALTIADAKRGDIGNTARRYAKAFYDELGFDAITVNPYMGLDSLEPYFEYENKWVFVLGLTSNTGAADFQLSLASNPPLYAQVMDKVVKAADNAKATVGFVVGATQTEHLRVIRELAPNQWLLVPGVGSQGGELAAVMQWLKTPEYGVLVNSSRSIIYASSGENFANDAAAAAAELARQSYLGA